MVRTQVQLTDEQYDALKRLAEARRVSLAALVRDAVGELLRQEQTRNRREMRERAKASVGRFRSGHSDISERHDDHLADAFGSG